MQPYYTPPLTLLASLSVFPLRLKSREKGNEQSELMELLMLYFPSAQPPFREIYDLVKIVVLLHKTELYHKTNVQTVRFS